MLNGKPSGEEAPTGVQKTLPLSPSNQAFDSFGVLNNFLDLQSKMKYHLYEYLYPEYHTPSIKGGNLTCRCRANSMNLLY